MRQVGCLIHKYSCATQTALPGLTSLSYKKKLFSEGEVLVTGSVAEGASLARMFSPDENTSKEFEMDIMLTFLFVKSDESLLQYVEKNKLYVHVTVDSSLLDQIISLFGEDGYDLLYKGDSTYLNSIHFKEQFQWTSLFDKNPLYRFSVSKELASKSASVASWVDSLIDDDTNSNTQLFDLALQLKPCCESFDFTFASMLQHVLLLQTELTDMHFGDGSVSLQCKVAKALEWAKACMEIADLIFNCRQDTMCTFLYRSVGLDLSSMNERPHAYIRRKLEAYIEKLTVTLDDISDMCVAVSVCDILDQVDEDMKHFPDIFQRLASDVTLFSQLVNFAQQNPQLCDNPPNVDKLSAIIKRCSVDCVPCIQLSFWPSVASEWTTRHRLWPDQSVIQHTVSKGVHLVGKAFCHDVMDWRLSFSVAEIDLALLWSAVQHFVYFVFKALFYKFIKPLSSSTNDEDLPQVSGRKCLASYLAKTLMMWTSESFDQSWWTEDNAGECLVVLLLALQSAFETRTLHHYFVPSVNLLEDFPEDLARRVTDVVDFILTDPAAVIDQLKSHFDKIDVFFNAMSEEAKSVEDMMSLYSVLCSTVVTLSLIHI